MQKTKKAFTFIELMIVIVILSLLATLVVPNLLSKSQEAKAKLACIQMKMVKDALDNFKLSLGTYPSTQEGLEALVHNPDPEKYPNYTSYLKKVPKDPWGGKYIYINNDNNIDIISLGADKKEGGDGENKDIRFSQCQK
ncbi:MAG: type II secretion system major pseudopilin GspG [Epsilonproteobacteria bacterium]|nr:type II secretion system major pseudopilin GspG [Campylobacterota bacterium]